MIEDLVRLLRPGGCLHLATDFFDYYLQVVVLLSLQPDLELDRDPQRVPAYAAAELSRYGPRLTVLGKSMHYATARRRK